ncbi:MAG: hypothetical protein JW720_11340 [Sedimentisphaerales bacterium]|nr:hypothetical protein [Sedimentisphaerales bacterium]
MTVEKNCSARDLLILLNAAILLTSIGCKEKDAKPTAQTKTYTESTIFNAFLNAVEQPELNEFPEAESAVRFMLEQTRTMNHDKASRVLAIVEQFERQSFETSADRLRTIAATLMPLPNPSLRNLNRAFGALTDFDTMCLELLTPDREFTGMNIYLREETLKEEIDDWKKKLNVKNLATLKIKSIETPQPLQMSDYAELLSVSEISEIGFVVENLGFSFDGTATAAKFDTNWKILHCRIGVSDEVSPEE